MQNIVVIDAQNDFISGALACIEGTKKAEQIVEFIASLEKGARVFYTQDWHGHGHCSFANNGGTWVMHCVAGTMGAALFSGFSKLPHHTPTPKNTYKKASQDDKEEYSCCFGVNSEGTALFQAIENAHNGIGLQKPTINLVGFATEFCVLQSALGFERMGFEVNVLSNLCGFISKEGHEKALKKMLVAGINII